MGNSRVWQSVLIALVCSLLEAGFAVTIRLPLPVRNWGISPWCGQSSLPTIMARSTRELVVHAGTGKEPSVLVLLDNLGKEVWSGAPNAKVVLRTRHNLACRKIASWRGRMVGTVTSGAYILLGGVCLVETKPCALPL